jgi:hypothetical protein
MSLTYKNKRRIKMDEDLYYKAMQNFDKLTRVDTAVYAWRKCFFYILSKRGYNLKASEDLFNNFNMENWYDLHKENTKYETFIKEELYEEFCSECCYICDRVDLDRLFRTHCLFLNWRRM